MSIEKEKWFDEVFDSMKGAQKAKPSPVLFAKIESQIGNSSTNIISIGQWRKYAAAVALVLFMNVSVLVYYQQSQGVSNQDFSSQDVYDESLISTFQIYN